MSKVYLDVKIGDEPIGRIVCELFYDRAPKTCENFSHFIKGDISVNGRQLTYQGNHFHRVIKNFMIQAGDVIFGSEYPMNINEVGKGGCSIYATEKELIECSDNDIKCYGNFEDENLGDFDESFILAMANTGSKNTNSSQFFITTNPSPHLNGKHSKFGRVVAGKSVVRTVERCPVDDNGVPKVSALIEDCGLWNENMAIPLYNACNDPIGNDYYEENPEDDSHFDGEDFAEAFKATECIKESGSLLFGKRDFKNALFKYLKSLKYVNEYIPEPEVNAEFASKFVLQKNKLYLNICLMLFYLKDYTQAKKYATFVIESDDALDDDKAKAYFRRGNCNYALKRLDLALSDYKKSKELSPSDGKAGEKIVLTEDRLSKEHERTKRSLGKFFQ